MTAAPVRPPHSDTLTVELVAPDDMQAAARIVWQLQPTVCDPRRFLSAAAVIAPVCSPRPR